MVATARKKYVCAICGVALRGERWVMSKHSGERFCAVVDWNDCAERADKKVRSESEVTTSASQGVPASRVVGGSTPPGASR